MRPWVSSPVPQRNKKRIQILSEAENLKNLGNEYKGMVMYFLYFSECMNFHNKEYMCMLYVHIYIHKHESVYFINSENTLQQAGLRLF